jgi:hypothetical protein
MRKVSFENEKQQIIVAFRTRTLNIAKLCTRAAYL